MVYDRLGSIRSRYPEGKLLRLLNPCCFKAPKGPPVRDLSDLTALISVKHIATWPATIFCLLKNTKTVHRYTRSGIKSEGGNSLRITADQTAKIYLLRKLWIGEIPTSPKRLT